MLASRFATLVNISSADVEVVVVSFDAIAFYVRVVAILPLASVDEVERIYQHPPSYISAALGVIVSHMDRLELLMVVLPAP